MTMIRKLLLFVVMYVLASAMSGRTIYISRHGQVGDKACYDSAVRESRLTPLGEEQAQALAAYLVETRKFGGTVLVSPLLRTIQTGSFTARLLKRPVVLEPGIQELNEGRNARGMSLAEIGERFGQDAVPGPAFKENWRVSNEDSQARARRLEAAWARILKEQQGDLLLVGHGASVSGLVAIIKKQLPQGAACETGTAWNCCLFTVTLDDEDKPVSLAYTTEYLPDEKVTSNFNCPKIERPDDPKYLTRKQTEERNRKKAAARAAAKAAAAKAGEEAATGGKAK